MAKQGPLFRLISRSSQNDGTGCVSLDSLPPVRLLPHEKDRVRMTKHAHVSSGGAWGIIYKGQKMQFESHNFLI